MRCDEAPKVPRVPVQGMELGPAEADDLAAIHAIYASCGFDVRSPEEMRARFEDGRHVHAVARHDGKVVAFAELETHWPRRPWVAFVGVTDALRDRGVGSALVAWALARAFEGEAESALLILSPANRTAVRAYSKVGFRLHRTFDVLEKGLVEP
jgi:predicted GNAT family acetyltransferase